MVSGLDVLSIFHCYEDQQQRCVKELKDVVFRKGVLGVGGALDMVIGGLS